MLRQRENVKDTAEQLEQMTKMFGICVEMSIHCSKWCHLCFFPKNLLSNSSLTSYFSVFESNETVLYNVFMKNSKNESCDVILFSIFLNFRCSGVWLGVSRLIWASSNFKIKRSTRDILDSRHIDKTKARRTCLLKMTNSKLFWLSFLFCMIRRFSHGNTCACSIARIE